MKPAVVIVDYNPQWPKLFEEEKSQILRAIGKQVIAIEHIGSTAVIGLGSKPVIDIMIGIRKLDDAKHCFGPLGKIGYTYVSDFEAQIPERRFLRKGEKADATHHLHIVEMTSKFWEIHLLFRDYLRNHPKTAQEYLLLKKKLALKFTNDRDSYTSSKTDFIESINSKALAEKNKKS